MSAGGFISLMYSLYLDYWISYLDTENFLCSFYMIMLSFPMIARMYIHKISIHISKAWNTSKKIVSTQTYGLGNIIMLATQQNSVKCSFSGIESYRLS